MKNKYRVIAGIILAAGLYIITLIYLQGSLKKLLIAFALCLVTGASVAVPKIKNTCVNMGMTIIYLLYVPKKIFERMELPVHDMSRLQEGVLLMNILMICLLYAVFSLVLQSVGKSFFAVNILLMCLTVANYFVFVFRGSSISIGDIMAVDTALSVAKGYQLTLSGEIWYSVLYMIAFAFFGAWCSPVVIGKRAHVIVSAVSGIYLLFFAYLYNGYDYLEKHNITGHYWNMSDNEALNGLLLSLAVGAKENSMEVPAGYSEENVQALLREYDGKENGEIRPNIIFIMNEAWSDLRVLGEIETNQPFMPFVDSLEENVVKGYTYVNILGGLTANSEFEALTGDALAFLSPSAIPYQLQVNHDILSLAEVLGECGYATMAMHPSGGNAWNRKKVYDYMGFDEFIDIEAFQTEPAYVRAFISDECNFDEIIYRYENRDKEKPWFLFDVTIQNHGDYYGGLELPIEVGAINGISAEDVGYTYDLQTYLNLMKVTDDAFKQLLEYFAGVQEPVIICMFGDHQPKLGDAFYNAVSPGGINAEETLQKYATQYIIWTNYDADLKEYGDMSVNYLGAALLDAAGIQSEAYYGFLNEMRSKYPVLTHYGCKDEAGNYWRQEDILEEDAIRNYRMLQYYHLFR